MASPKSKQDWTALIEPHLSVSLRDASDAITRTEPVQQWLQSASMEAARGLGNASGVQGQMQGYIQMMNALEDDLPELLDAVSDLTEGCGTLDLHWRPTNPNFSRLYVDFGRDLTVSVFVRVESASTEGMRTAIETVAEALPEGAPFPNRPNTVTGMVGFQGACVGVRVSEELADEEKATYRFVTLLPPNREDVENLGFDAAANRLLVLLDPDQSSEASS